MQNKKYVVQATKHCVVKQGGDRHLAEGWQTHRVGRGEITGVPGYWECSLLLTEWWVHGCSFVCTKYLTIKAFKKLPQKF